MEPTTTQVEVSVSELRTRLSRYLRDVADGTRITVTHRGRPMAQLISVNEPDGHLADLVARGDIQPARTRIRYLPERIVASGTVFDLIAEQRR